MDCILFYVSWPHGLSFIKPVQLILIWFVVMVNAPVRSLVCPLQSPRRSLRVSPSLSLSCSSSSQIYCTSAEKASMDLRRPIFRSTVMHTSVSPSHANGWTVISSPSIHVWRHCMEWRGNALHGVNCTSWNYEQWTQLCNTQMATASFEALEG